MSLFRVTFTGVDGKTDLRRLNQLSTDYPFIEWGVLFSRSKQGLENRYPNLNVIADFVNLEKPIKSAHICGNWTGENRNYQCPRDIAKALYDLFGGFNRYQFNISNAKDAHSYEIFHQNVVNCDNLPFYQGGFVNYPKFILQSKSFNLTQQTIELLSYIRDYDGNVHNSNHNDPLIHVLLDNSGGIGRVLDIVAPPEDFRYTPGYAGGINPENVAEVIGKIEALNLKQDYWIDMETGVRIDDWFDLDKCEAVAKIAKQFIH